MGPPQASYLNYEIRLSIQSNGYAVKILLSPSSSKLAFQALPRTHNCRSRFNFAPFKGILFLSHFDENDIRLFFLRSIVHPPKYWLHRTHRRPLE